MFDPWVWPPPAIPTWRPPRMTILPKTHAPSDLFKLWSRAGANWFPTGFPLLEKLDHGQDIFPGRSNFLMYSTLRKFVEFTITNGSDFVQWVKFSCDQFYFCLFHIHTCLVKIKWNTERLNFVKIQSTCSQNAVKIRQNSVVIFIFLQAWNLTKFGLTIENLGVNLA